MNGWEWAAIALGAWCALSVPAAILTGAWLRARTPSPAASPPPAPASPGEGLPEAPQAPQAGQPSPGSGEHLTHGRRLLTVRFYEDGASCVWDATGAHVATFQGAHDWDQWLRRMTRDGV